MGERINLLGQRFGKLVVYKEGAKDGKRRMWWCKCDCGNITSLLKTPSSMEPLSPAGANVTIEPLRNPTNEDGDKIRWPSGNPFPSNE
jgi:hypothetical protein